MHENWENASQNLALVGWSALLSSVGAASKEGKKNAARLDSEHERARLLYWLCMSCPRE